VCRSFVASCRLIKVHIAANHRNQFIYRLVSNKQTKRAYANENYEKHPCSVKTLYLYKKQPYNLKSHFLIEECHCFMQTFCRNVFLPALEPKRCTCSWQRRWAYDVRLDVERRSSQRQVHVMCSQL